MKMDLAYGQRTFEFSFDEDRFSVLNAGGDGESPLSDFEGLGRPDFLKWFDASDSRALEARLVNGYEVNGQTAWALLTKSERHRVYLISELQSEIVKRMRMIPVRTISEALEGASGDGFILPRGAAVLPRMQAT